MTTQRPLGFKYLSLMTSGGGKNVARFQCSSCPVFIDINAGKSNPETLAQRARDKGWAAVPYRSASVACPSCVAPKPRNDPNSELKRLPLMPIQPNTPDPTSLTGDQRMQIRSYLDKSFDDQQGVYLDDMSDAKIAELVNVPRLVVEKMRETAYGPIKVDPAIVGLRNETAQLKREIEAAAATLDGLKARQIDIVDRIEKHRKAK